MSRYSIILGCMAVVGFLALTTPQGHAQSDVDGMDHSKLNHGVLGHSMDADHRPMADVNGMDHSKLNHGVLGSASAKPHTKPTTSSDGVKWQSPKF